MWQQWFATPGFRYATGERLTVLKFEAQARADMTAAQRREEILAWLERSHLSGFDDWLADQAADAIRRAAIELRLEVDVQADRFRLEHDRLIEQAAEARAAIRAMQATRAWRVATTAWGVRDRLLRLPPLRWLTRRSSRPETSA